MLVSFHPGIAHRHRCCLAYYALRRSPNVSLSGVIYIALTLNTDKTELSMSQPNSQSVRIQRGGRTAAAAWQWEAGWEGSHLVNAGATGVSNCRPLSWDCGQVLLHSSQHVCVSGMHGHRHEWLYTGCAALSLTRFRLANDSRVNGSSIGAISLSQHKVHRLSTQVHKCTNIMSIMRSSTDKASTKIIKYTNQAQPNNTNWSKYVSNTRITYSCHYAAADDFRMLTHESLSADFRASGSYTEICLAAVAVAAASNASVVLALWWLSPAAATALSVCPPQHATDVWMLLLLQCLLASPTPNNGKKYHIYVSRYTEPNFSSMTSMRPMHYVWFTLFTIHSPVFLYLFIISKLHMFLYACKYANWYFPYWKILFLSSIFFKAVAQKPCGEFCWNLQRLF